MSNPRNTTVPSPIATLAKARQTILACAIRDNRDLTASEADRVEALDMAIAHSAPANRRDAAEQVRVACEALELLCHGETAAAPLEAAYSALCSARALLAA